MQSKRALHKTPARMKGLGNLGIKVGLTVCEARSLVMRCADFMNGAVSRYTRL